MNALCTRIAPIVLALTARAAATTFTWTGATDGNWNTATNWDAGIPTSAVDTALVFDNAVQPTMIQNIPGGLTLNSLHFTANSSTRGLTGNALTFDGTAPSLSTQSTDASDIRIGTPIILNQTLNVTGGPTFDAQLLFTSTAAISGPGGLNWLGGIGFNNAASSFTGPLTISGGTLGTNVSTGFGAGTSVTILDGGALQVRNGANINKALSIAGNGFSGSAALNASTTIGTWSGPITLAAPARVGSFSGGTLVLTGGIALAGNQLTVSPNTDSFVTIGSVISGVGNVVKNGPGRMSLNTTPTFTGLLDVQAGSLSLGVSNVLPADFPLNIAAGASVITNAIPHTTDASAITGTGDIVLSPGSTFTIDNPVDRTLTVRFTSASTSTSSTHTLAKSGAGILTLAGSPAFYSGSTIINAGTIRLGADEQIGESPASFAAFAPGCFLDLLPGTTLDLNGFDETVGALRGSGNILLPAGSVLTSTIALTGQVSPNFDGVLSGPGTFRFSSLGQSHSFLKDQLHSGGTVILSGGLRASRDLQIGASGAPLTLTNGSLVYESDFTLDPARPIIADGTNGGVVYDNFTTTIGSNISGPGRFNKSGNGTLILTGTNTQANGIRINEGTLEVSSITQTGSGGSFDFGFRSGFTVTPATLKVLGSITVPADRSTAFQSWTVDTNGFDVTFNQPLNGRELTKTGSGTLTINGANTTTENNHSVSVLEGSLRLGTTNALGTGVILIVAETAELEITSGDQTMRTLSASGPVDLGNSTLTLRIGGVFAAPVSGTGAIVYDGGSGQLNAPNSFSGGLTIKNNGAVLVASTAGLGAPGSPITLDNGELGTNTFATEPVVIDPTTNFTIGPGGARFSSAGQSLVISAALAGSAPLRFTGGSGPNEESKYEVRLAHPANTFVGDVILGNSQIGLDSTLGIVANGSLGAPSNVVRLGDRFFDGETTRENRGTLRAFADLTLPEDRTIILRTDGEGGVLDTNGFAMVVEGPITESFSGSTLSKTGEGTLFLNGQNSYTGRTSVLEGYLGGTGKVAAVELSTGAGLAPGESPGVLETGDLNFSFGSKLALEFASPTAGDQVAVTGSVALFGDVQLELDLGYSVAVSDTFTVILNDGIDPIDTNGGFFAIGEKQLTEGESFIADGALWTISYVGGTGNDVTLTVVPEPGVGALWLLGGLGITCIRRRHRRISCSS